MHELQRHPGRQPWRLISNHGAALIYFAARPASTMRQAALALGMSHRRTAGIVRELAGAGMLVIEKRGVHNTYRVNLAAHFPHPFLSHLPVGLMLTPVVDALIAGPHGVDSSSAEDDAASPIAWSTDVLEQVRAASQAGGGGV